LSVERNFEAQQHAATQNCTGDGRAHVTPIALRREYLLGSIERGFCRSVYQVIFTLPELATKVTRRLRAYAERSSRHLVQLLKWRHLWNTITVYDEQHVVTRRCLFAVSGCRDG